MPVIPGARQGSIGVTMMCAKPYAVTWVKNGINYRIYRISDTTSLPCLANQRGTQNVLGEA